MLEPVGKTSKIIDSLMKFLFLKLKENEMTISERRMQKFIFKVKMELGNNHELYDKLPYYWYFHGPFSELVRDSFNEITSAYCSTHNHISYILNGIYEDFNEILDIFPNLNKIANNIIKDKDSFYKNLIELVYKEYAPYKILYPFRYNIYKIADDYESLQSLDTDNYINQFYDCESLLPEEDYFLKFSDIYSQFATNLDLINDNDNLIDNWQILRKPIINLWETFTSGVRVNHKDKYYNNNVFEWNNEFNLRIDNLALVVDKTEHYINHKNFCNQYSSTQKNILNSTIGTYLR